MARPRKPLAAQQGHLKVVDMQRKKEAEQSYNQSRERLYKKPDRLINSTAEEMWDIVMEEVEKNDFYGNLDLFNLTSYCNAVANYIAVENELKDQDFVIRNQKGEKVENPLIGVKKKCMEEVQRFERLAGISIDCRLRIGENKAQKQQNTIMEKFEI